MLNSYSIIIIIIIIIITYSESQRFSWLQRVPATDQTLLILYSAKNVQTIRHVENVHIKTLKNAPTCFDHNSDHLQGARMFLVKVTDFKIC